MRILPPSQLLEEAIQNERVLDAAGPLTLSPCAELADAIRAFGVTPREGVAICFENGRACINAYVALALADAVAVPLPPTLPAAQRSELWRQIGCRVVVDRDGVRLLGNGVPRPIPWPADVYWVMHSSGSTGVPKAIAITYSAVVRNAIDVMRALGGRRGMTHVGSMSHCYTNGLFNSFLLPLVTDGRSFVGPVATVLGFGAYLQAVEQSAAEILWVNPTVVSVLLKRGSPHHVRHAELLVSCTAPLDQSLSEEAAKTVGRPVLQSYGLTETLIVTVESPQRRVVDEFSAGLPVAGPASIRCGSARLLEIENGAVTPGYATIVDGAIVLALPDGDPGVRFVSSDVASIDASGRLYLSGRVTGVINVGGVKISGEGLERLLRSWPGVSNAAVAPIAISGALERPAALLEADSGVDLIAIADHCASVLGGGARPAKIVCVRQMPLTANGKIDRRAVQTLLEAQ